MALIRVDNGQRLVKWIVVLAITVVAASALRRAVSLPYTAVAVWPTVGLFCGFLLVAEIRYWWLICVLCFSLEYPFAIGSFSYEPQASTITKVAIYYGLLILGCWVLRRRYPDGMSLHRLAPDLRDFFIFVVLFCLVLAVIEPVLVSAVGGLSFGGLGWYHWALANAATLFIWTPAVVAWSSQPANWRSIRSRSAVLEFLVLALTIGGLVLVGGSMSAAVQESLYGLVWIPLLISVFRFDLRFVTLLTIWVSIAVSVSLALGGGPYRFLSANPSQQVLATSAYLLSFATVLVLLSSVLAGRADLRRKRDRLSDIIFESNKLHSIGAFAAGLAHDWNNLMLVLGFEKDNLKERASNDPALASTADVLENVVEQGRAITDDLLAFARRDNEPLSTCDLEKEVRVAVDLARRAIPIDCNISLDLYKSRTPFVNAKRSHLHQIVLNLVFNARDAIADGGGTVDVEIHGPTHRELRGEESRVAVIYIIDQGEGMSAELIERAFEPLYTTRAKRGGTGLGLPVVKGLVADLGGEIAISSQGGQGTTVSVMLPTASE